MVQMISRMMVAATPDTLFERDPQPGLPAEDTPGLSRLQLLERIMGLNTTATAEYLSTFSDLSLSRSLGIRRLAPWGSVGAARRFGRHPRA